MVALGQRGDVYEEALASPGTLPGWLGVGGPWTAAEEQAGAAYRRAVKEAPDHGSSCGTFERVRGASTTERDTA